MNRTIVFILIFTMLTTFIPTSAFAIPDESKAINKIPSTNPNIDKLILVEGNPATMSADIKNGKLHINDKLHTHRQVRLNYIELFKNLRGFNGQTLGYTHINDYGVITRKIIDVGEIDNQGFISIEMTFSTVIVDGFVGTTTTILTGLSGNQSISVPDGSSYNLNITNNHPGTWASCDGKNYTNKAIITVNGSMVTTESQIPLQLFTNLEGVNGTGDIGIAYTNLTAIPREVEAIWDSDNVSLYFPFNTTSGVDSQFVVLWGSDNNTEPAADSTYGSEAVWDSNYKAIWLMNQNSDSNILDSTSNGYTGTYQGSPLSVDGDNGKGIQFDGSTDYFIVGVPFSAYFKKGNEHTVIAIVSTTLSANSAIIASTDWSSPYIGYQFQIMSTGKAQTEMGGSSGSSTTMQVEEITTDIINDGSYHLIANSFDGVDAAGNIIYIDGAIPDTTTNYDNLDVATSTTNTQIGARDGANLPYAGIISFLSISDTVRSSNYIATTYKNLNNPTAGGTYPFYKSIGSTQTVSVAINITASVTGDNNTQSYNTSQSREFTLTPTGSTNNLIINTTSTDYDVTVTTYWTEDTVKFTETIDNGFANTTIQYTPSFNITSGVLNSTYNLINFADHDYTGNLSTFVDGVNYDSNSTRDGNDVNVSIVNFNTSTHWINFSVAYNPPLDLYSPNDTATLSYAYPPLTHDVVLSWEQSTGIYKYTVTDYDTGAIISSNTANTNTTTVPLSSGHYKWYIKGYDDVFDEYSILSEIRSFTVEDTYSYTNDTVLHGIVYEYISGVGTPLDNALVNIWNDTWSDSQMTGTNGYFVFQNLHNSTYFLKATKNGYLESVTEIATLPYNTTSSRDILLQLSDGAGQQYVDHYVKFTVKSLWETLYSDVAVTVYRGEEVTALYTGTTGEDGSVAFELNENQEYRITFIDAAQNINKEITLYPVNNDYVIYVFTWTYIPDDTPLQTIDYGIASESINLTAGTIYASFTDTESTFTHANFTIKAEDETVLHSFTTTDTSKNWSQIVTYNNSTIYIAVLEIFDTGLTNGKITQSAVISFKYGIRDNFDLGWEEQWQYQLFGALLMLFVAGLFSMTNAHLGAIIVVGIGWFNIYAGWFPPTITGSLMMLLGTFLAVIFVMRKQEKI